MKWTLAVGVICLGLFTGGCGAGPGSSDNTQVVRGESSRFSVEEIEAAESAVMEKFKEFKGCELLRLAYHEADSDQAVESYLTYGGGSQGGVAKDDVIVLYSDFHVGARGGDGSLNRDSDYTGWNWILTREGKSAPWEVSDYGY
jgi:hypothetical protein